jgi:hypothetical protein
MHEARSRAFDTAIHCTFASPAHKLAVLSLIAIAHVADDGRLGFFDNRREDGMDLRVTLTAALQADEVEAMAVYQDLVDCGAITAFEPASALHCGNRRFLDWPQATVRRMQFEPA